MVIGGLRLKVIFVCPRIVYYLLVRDYLFLLNPFLTKIGCLDSRKLFTESSG